MDVPDMETSHPSDLHHVHISMSKVWYFIGTLQLMFGVALNVLWTIVISNSSHYELSAIQLHPVLPYVYLLVPLIYVSSGIMAIATEKTENTNGILTCIYANFVSCLAALALTMMHGAKLFALPGAMVIFAADITSLFSRWTFALGQCAQASGVGAEPSLEYACSRAALVHTAAPPTKWV
ncbi:hypothetical protein GW7_11814 [Heterocephalus glaber]|uniref:Uncharacterized protein n=1 Tax=Heterocephalus glaber TaxID=10181 RepID=G5BTX6_HETGA|nr:hypothetical protein GW7_11814 [Heterocephalus glaber]